MTPEEYVAVSRARQGLPPTVVDESALAVIAAVIAPAGRVARRDELEEVDRVAS